jgi:hypothetical protein
MLTMRETLMAEMGFGEEEEEEDSRARSRSGRRSEQAADQEETVE